MLLFIKKMFGRRKCLIERSPYLPELLFFLYGFICQGSVLPDNCSLLRNTQNSDFLFKLWPNSQSVSTKYELLCAWFPWLNLWSHIWTFGICGIFWEQLLGNEILIYWVLVRLVIVDIKKKNASKRPFSCWKCCLAKAGFKSEGSGSCRTLSPCSWVCPNALCSSWIPLLLPLLLKMSRNALSSLSTNAGAEFQCCSLQRALPVWISM